MSKRFPVDKIGRFPAMCTLIGDSRCELLTLLTGKNGTGYCSMVTAFCVQGNKPTGRCLINVGDSTLRILQQHRVKLSAINTIIITSLAPHNCSGLSGVLLSLSDLGVAKVKIIGPAGVDILLHTITPFTNRKYPNVECIVINNQWNCYECININPCFAIFAKPVYAKQNRNGQPVAISTTIFPCRDNENNVVRIASGITIVPVETAFKLYPSSVALTKHIHDEYNSQVERILFAPVSVNYTNYSDKLVTKSLASICNKLKIFGIYTSGMLDNMVCELHQSQKLITSFRSVSNHYFPAPLACIDDYIAANISSMDELVGACNEEDKEVPSQVVTATSYFVVNKPLLQFEFTPCVIAVPILHNSIDMSSDSEDESDSDNEHLNIITTTYTCPVDPIRHLGDTCLQYLRLIKSNTAVTKPTVIGKDDAEKSSANNSAAMNLRDKLRSQIGIKRPRNDDNHCLPCSTVADMNGGSVSITFLGTGSATPSKNRCNSCVMLQYEDNIILLDVGEGAASQLYYNVSGNQTQYDNLLSKISIIWLSHHHADHICGLPLLLQQINRATYENKTTRKKIIIIGSNIVVQYYEFVVAVTGLDDMVEFRVIADNNTALDVTSISFVTNLISIPVYHCMDSYGIILQLSNGCKVVYSGDCRPSKSIICAGYKCDVLIHEATFDDTLGKDAIAKKHCTTTEALDVGKQMAAKHVILTHFSQRYSVMMNAGNIASYDVKNNIRKADYPPFAIAYDFLNVVYPNGIDLLPLETSKCSLIMS